MRVVAVLPFAAEEVDPDAYDLARWLAADVAAELSVPNVIEARLVVDVVEISPYALGEAATQLRAEAALGATLHLAEGVVSLAAMLVGPDGKLRAEWAEALPLGAATRLPRMLARATLLALGEDASAPAQNVEPEAPSPPRHPSNPCSAKLRYASFPTITWSSTGMSSSRPASTSCLVTARSSADGVGSPDGWLWHRITDAARDTIAAQNTSRGCTSDELSIPRVIASGAPPISRCCTSSASSQNTSTGSRSAYGTIRSNTSRGVRIGTEAPG